MANCYGCHVKGGYKIEAWVRDSSSQAVTSIHRGQMDAHFAVRISTLRGVPQDINLTAAVSAGANLVTFSAPTPLSTNWTPNTFLSVQKGRPGQDQVLLAVSNAAIGNARLSVADMTKADGFGLKNTVTAIGLDVIVPVQ